MQAALMVASLSVKLQRIKELRNKYPFAILLPIMGRNKLPVALALLTGLNVCFSVHEIQTIKRKELSAMERLLYKPQFCGSISPGNDYIIVDDIVTQGGTVSALRQFILSNGGFVVAITALAYSIGSGIIAPIPERVCQLVDKFEYSYMINILRSYNMANELQEMTNSQIKYLTRFKTLERIVKKIKKVTKMVYIENVQKTAELTELLSTPYNANNTFTRWKIGQWQRPNRAPCEGRAPRPPQ